MDRQQQLEAFRDWIQKYDHYSLRNEDDVETKFVLPLFHHLGYPEECRRGKLQVKAYKPGRRGQYPAIDQIYFSTGNQNKQDRDTSLVIVEAKTPSKSISLLDIEQAGFYGYHTLNQCFWL